MLWSIGLPSATGLGRQTNNHKRAHMLSLDVITRSTASDHSQQSQNLLATNCTLAGMRLVVNELSGITRGRASPECCSSTDTGARWEPGCSEVWGGACCGEEPWGGQHRGQSHSRHRMNKLPLSNRLRHWLRGPQLSCSPPVVAPPPVPPSRPRRSRSCSWPLWGAPRSRHFRWRALHRHRWNWRSRITGWAGAVVCG